MIEQLQTLNIPPKNREEWLLLVTGKLNHRFSNFVLQLKSTEYQRDIEENRITPEEAVDEIYKLCEKYSLAVQNDFKQIFKEW